MLTLFNTSFECLENAVACRKLSKKSLFLAVKTLFEVQLLLVVHFEAAN